MAIKKYIYSLMTDRRQDHISQVWKFVLWLLSLVYGVIVVVTRRLYAVGILPSYKAPKTVISVGNLTVGGSGKTPLVIAIAQSLMERGLRPAILIRGYMPKGGKANFSDEARMLQEDLQGVPILVGANRRKSIEESLKHHAIDVFICDDGFQHWPLKRDLDIVAVDAGNIFGNGCLVPRGILREPVNAMKHAQIIVLTKTDHHTPEEIDQLHGRLGSINPEAMIVRSLHKGIDCVDVWHKYRHHLNHFKGVSVAAFCGIADPESFRRSLHAAGFHVANVFVFMDHHMYTKEDMAMMQRWMRDNHIQIIMMTHKDAVKIQDFKEFWNGFRVYYVHMALEITHGKNAFLERIISAVRA